jgi:hypothetical protein
MRDPWLRWAPEILPWEWFSRAANEQSREGLTLEESRNYVKRILVLAAGYRSLYPDLG